MDIDPDRPIDRPASAKGGIVLSSIEAVRRQGFVPYSAGPVYFIGRANESLASRFCREKSKQVQGFTIDLPFEVLDPVFVGPSWSRRLEFISKEIYDEFIDWLMTVELYSREEKFYYVLRRYPAAVLDPLVREQGLPKPAIATIDVMSVSGLEFDLHPRSNISAWQVRDRIDFEKCAPEPVVVDVATKMLDELKGGL